jgi:hypothetical protein
MKETLKTSSIRSPIESYEGSEGVITASGIDTFGVALALQCGIRERSRSARRMEGPVVVADLY